jgi:hypothetical protein
MGHEGRRTIYTYDWKAYRRGLQIVRLRRRGVTKRDAIKLQLFRCGYSLPAHDVRTALCAEYTSHAATLMAPTRSRYIEGPRPIRGKHRAALVRSMGDLDPDLDAAGYRLPSETYIHALRVAKGGPLDVTPAKPRSRTVVGFLAGRLSWAATADTAVRLLAGMLLLGKANTKDSGGPIDYVERLIATANDQSLEAARDLLAGGQIAARRFKEFARYFGLRRGIAEKHRAWLKVASAAADPNWAPTMLLIALLLITKFRIAFRPQEIVAMFDRMQTERFTFRSIFRRMPVTGKLQLEH